MYYIVRVTYISAHKTQCFFTVTFTARGVRIVRKVSVSAKKYPWQLAREKSVCDFIVTVLVLWYLWHWKSARDTIWKRVQVPVTFQMLPVIFDSPKCPSSPPTCDNDAKMSDSGVIIYLHYMIYIFRSIIQPSLPTTFYSKCPPPLPPKKRSVFDSIFAIVTSKGPFFSKSAIFVNLFP